RYPRPRHVLRPRGLHGGADQPGRMGRTVDGPRLVGGVRGARGLRRQLPHRAGPAPGVDHGDARTWPADLRTRQCHDMADRRHRWAAPAAHMAGAGLFQVRPVGLHLLWLRVGYPVGRLPDQSQDRQFGIRSGTAGRARECAPHARNRVGTPGPPAEDLGNLRRARRCCRRHPDPHHQHGCAGRAEFRALGRRGGDADPRRHRAALRRDPGRYHLPRGAGPARGHQSSVLVFLDRPALDGGGALPAQWHPRRAGASGSGEARLTEPMLETRGLTKRFGSLEVARDVSIVLPRGARHALIGPNGAGKTTLINLITGQLKPDAGQILLAGEDVTNLATTARVRRGLTRTFQINTLFPDLTPIEAVTLAVCERDGVAGQFWRSLTAHEAAIEESYTILRELSLADVATRRTRTLAYGQQRLLEIALALATRPRVLLLDEPAA